MIENKKIAVITGHSSGLGAALTDKFKSEGFFIVGVARHDGKEFPADCFVYADLSDSKSLAAAVDFIAQQFPEIDVLINNAGIGAYARWEDLSEEDMRRIVEIDFFAPVKVTKKLLNSLKNAHGTVINISSAAGLAAIPCMGIYSSVKFALRAFSESLRSELKNHNVSVLTVFPGRISTGFGSRCLGDRQPPKTPGQRRATPEKFAQKLYKAYVNKRRKLIYPAWYRMFVLLVEFFPGIFEKENIKRWKL